MRAHPLLLLLLLVACNDDLAPGPRRVLVVGDSLSSGGPSWVTYLKKDVTNYGFDVLAKSGATSKEMASWVTSNSLDFRRYSHLILWGGINDSVSVEDTVNHLQMILWMAHECNPYIKTAVVEYPYWRTYPHWNSNWQDRLDIVYRCLRTGSNVDFYIENDVGIGRKVANSWECETTVDGLHLSEVGKVAVAEMIKRRMFPTK